MEPKNEEIFSRKTKQYAIARVGAEINLRQLCVDIFLQAMNASVKMRPIVHFLMPALNRSKVEVGKRFVVEQRM